MIPIPGHMYIVKIRTGTGETDVLATHLGQTGTRYDHNTYLPREAFRLLATREPWNHALMAVTDKNFNGYYMEVRIGDDTLTEIQHDELPTLLHWEWKSKEFDALLKGEPA